MKQILVMFILVILQNASFTLVSRARNSKSIIYHAIASVLSNGFWLLVIRNVVINLDNYSLMVTYLIASVLGSLLMHWFAMKFLEKKSKVKGNDKQIVILCTNDQAVNRIEQVIKQANKTDYIVARGKW